MLGTKVSQFIKKRYLVQPEKSVQPMGAELNESENDVSHPEPELELERENIPEPVIDQDPALNDYNNSRLGRIFGWWVCIDGQRVASLEYCCLLEELVHLYSVNVLDDKFLTIDLSREKWLGTNVTIQSRYAETFIRQGLNIAAVGQSMIVVENLSISEEHFRRRHQEEEEFHHKLVEKAKSKTR